MDKRVIIMSAVVGSLGVLGAILGFAAEGTKPTKYSATVVDGNECIYPSSPTLALGISASVFLVVAQITVSAAGGCCGCCCKTGFIPSKTRRIVGVICAVASWIAAVIGWLFLVAGAFWYADVKRPALYAAPSSSPNCAILEDGIFAGGAGLTLAATALGIASYIMLRGQPAAPDAAVVVETGAPAAARDKPAGEQQPPTTLPSTGIAMGHPQLPPPQQGYAQPPTR